MAMTFKEAMEHYRAGTASEQERQLVEQELEKSQLIAEYLDEQWDEKAFVPIAPTEEIKQVRKTLRRRNILIVLTSLALSAALLLGAVYIGIPAAEGLYWDIPVNLPFNSGITLPTALAVPVEDGMMLPAAARPPLQSFKDGPSTVF